MDSIKLADTKATEEMEFPGEKDRVERRSQKENLGFPGEVERKGTAAIPLPTEAAPVRYPVIMTIHAEQDFESNQPEKMELMTEGLMERNGSALTLSYEESALTGMEGTTTIFRIDGPQIFLQRSGTVCSQMTFEKGVQHTSLYETPYGELSVDILTSSLQYSLNENGGTVDICYSVSVEHANTGKNRFHLRVKRAN